eukprot:CAMPEP_0184731336 /NCGR_PEP_ID=MMETSP0314-20130426/50619_1 /TAXON_ID=38298 /ORGANISM="Rhodella maculata, Strain CCMP 736" /LENGTH=431 /DNA_ID=CAMNT_0027197703 /DNA_START=153 /DNA_END=1448 /DNA_ORIENTATION=+
MERFSSRPTTNFSGGNKRDFGSSPASILHDFDSDSPILPPHFPEAVADDLVTAARALLPKNSTTQQVVRVLADSAAARGCKGADLGGLVTALAGVVERGAEKGAEVRLKSVLGSGVTATVWQGFGEEGCRGFAVKLPRDVSRATNSSVGDCLSDVSYSSGSSFGYSGSADPGDDDAMFDMDDVAPAYSPTSSAGSSIASDNDRVNILREWLILSRLSHPHVLALVHTGACIPADAAPALLTELCPGGTLLSSTAATHGLPRPAAARVALNLASAMAHLHSRTPAVLHGDLKAANVFVRDVARPWDLAVGDFGAARLAGEDGAAEGAGATPVAVSAPEVLRGEGYSRKAEVFAYGVALWEACVGRAAYAGEDAVEVAYEVAEEGRRLDLGEVRWEKGRELIERCWREAPEERPEFEEIVEEMQTVVDMLDKE